MDEYGAQIKKQRTEQIDSNEGKHFFEMIIMIIYTLLTFFSAGPNFGDFSSKIEIFWKLPGLIQGHLGII